MRTAHVRTGAAGFALAVLTLAGAAAPAGATEAQLDPAGADLVSLSVADGDLSLHVRDANQIARNAVGHDPSDVQLSTEGGVAVRVPDNPAFSFLGAPGQAVWSLTSGSEGLPAFDTTGVRRGVVPGDTVTLSLAAEGPGRFTVYTPSGLGTAGLLLGTSAREVRLPAESRTPVVWAFDEPGNYRLTLSSSATLSTGRTVTTDATYQVTVPQIQPGPVVPPPAAAAPIETSRTPQLRPQNKGPTPVPRAAAASTPANRQPEAANAASASGERKVISDGHVDMGPQLVGRDWTIRIKDDTVSPAVWRELADVVLQVKENAKTTVPAGADFLGKEGDEVWLLPQAQRSGIVWPGWNTQHESVVSGTRGNVTWALTGVDGPGRFTLFLTGSFGNADVLFDSTKQLPQRLPIPPNTHAHGNWAFSEPGLYRLKVQMSGTTTDGRAVTDTKTLAIAVGDGTDPGTGFGSGSGDNIGDGDGDGSGSGGDGRLPRTGTSWILPAAAGGLLLVLGGGVLRFAVRRRRATDAWAG
ncbi:LPXTG cell wall anchor domain-containing protein [Micromonospora sp. 15K316]|uniref:TIGR03773 family transporter-associated surface protein n=1 Tax=Micromonospora sp. 15K316 TaxID=2530376 RepID=UPI0010453C53|nr:TIGR03773 family transporter-associated surface protein [Micromonospora sp. 15K316]TDC25135.1 LPXTG cell wall anchor domain-containing protein [Micromonospora sp. 15K316]